MEVQLVKNIITKLRANEVFHALNRWTFLSHEDVETLKSIWSPKQTKSVVSNSIAEFCSNKGGLKMDRVGDLDLICTQMYSLKRTWSAYHLIESQGKTQKMLTPEIFKRELTQLLRLYFTSRNSTASVMLHNGLMWGRVYLPHPGKKQYQPTMCLYFVYYPQTPIIIMNGMKATFEVFLKKCLLFVLRCKDIEEMSLNGHELESIAELAINKFSDGGYQKFQLTHRPNGPVGEVISRKRKVPEIEEHERITCEYLAEKRQRMEILDTTFGTTILPKLEKVEYRVELPYRGRGIASELLNQGDIFHSRVRFSGKSALEGIRNLAAAGYASVPLQKHLTCIPSRARNHFLLARKQPSERTNQHQETQGIGGDQSVTRIVSQSTPLRVQNRMANETSPQRVGSRTAKNLVKEQKTVSKKQREDSKTSKKQKIKGTQPKVLKENQSLNRTVNENSHLELRSKKKDVNSKENRSVLQPFVRTNSQQKHSNRKAKR